MTNKPLLKELEQVESNKREAVKNSCDSSKQLYIKDLQNAKYAA